MATSTPLNQGLLVVGNMPIIYWHIANNDKKKNTVKFHSTANDLFANTFKNKNLNKKVIAMSEKTNNTTFTSNKAAEYLSVAEISMRNSRISGLLGGIKAPIFRKIGRKVIYLKSDLDEWLINLPVFENTTQMKIEQKNG